MPRQLDNWLLSYLVYTNESKSPEEFHLWTGISIIAGALQRKVWFDMGYYKLYPNMYIVLVAPPGRCAKSTAMAIGRSMTYEVDWYPFAVESTSREKLIKSLSMNLKDGMSVLNVHASEFASFFATSAEKMLVFLTDIYFAQDEWTHETLSGSTNKIKGPFLNLLAGTTPESLERDVAVSAVGVGLVSRIIFVYSDLPRKRKWRPQLSLGQRKLGELLALDLKHIASVLAGPYAFTEDWDAAFQEFEDSVADNPNATGQEALDQFYERKPDHIKKLAMILAAAHKDEMILTAEDLALALDTLERVEARMGEVFRGVGRNPLVRDINDVLVDVLSDQAGVSRGELLIRFQSALRLDELDEVLTTLMIRGQIVLRDGRYFPTLKAKTNGNDPSLG